MGSVNEDNEARTFHHGGHGGSWVEMLMTIARSLTEEKLTHFE